MSRFIRIVLILAVCLAVTGPAAAATAPAAPAGTPRLVVFESFLRPNGCPNSASAAPVIDRLALEYAGKNVLFLEYDVDETGDTRTDHWIAAAGGSDAPLPLVMVESGMLFSSGAGEFHSRYTDMIYAVQKMAPLAELSASWQVINSASAEVKVTINNTSGINLGTDNTSHLHLIAYAEEAPESNSPYTHLTRRFVLGAYEYPLTLAKGDQANLTQTLAAFPGRSWETVKIVALVDYLQASGVYFTLQAAHVARDTTSPTMSVAENRVTRVMPAADTKTYTQTLHLSAPSTYAWKASVNAARPAEQAAPASQAAPAAVSWLQVTPAGGTGPAQVQVSILSSLLEAGAYQANIVISSPTGLFAPISVPVLAIKTVIPPTFLPLVRR